MKLEETNTSFQIKLNEQLDTHKEAVDLYTKIINDLILDIAKRKTTTLAGGVSPLEILNYFMQASKTTAQAFDLQEILQKAIENSNVDSEGFDWDDYWNDLREHFKKIEALVQSTSEKFNMDTDTDKRAVELYTESANKLLKALSKRKPNSIIGPNEILTYFMRASKTTAQVFNQQEIIQRAIENSNVNTEGFDWDGYWDELNDILKE